MVSCHPVTGTTGAHRRMSRPKRRDDTAFSKTDPADASCVGKVMRLPSHLLAKLTLAGVTIGAGCEQAHPPTCEVAPTAVETEPAPAHLDDIVRMTNEQRPAAAPRYVEPKLQPQPTRPGPQPVIKKKPRRMVWASVCGHTQLVDENAGLMRCGKG